MYSGKQKASKINEDVDEILETKAVKIGTPVLITGSEITR